MAFKKELNPDENIRLGSFGSKAAMGGMAIGVGGLAVALVAGFLQDDGLRRFFHAYLMGVSLIVTFALGALFFVIIQHLVRAKWSVTVRRTAEILSQTFPVLGILTAAGVVIPVLAGSDSLFVWANPDVVASDHLLHEKTWLIPWFWAVRMVFYFVVWTFLARYFFKKSIEQDESGDPEISERLRVAAGPGIVVFGITCGFSGFDFLMVLTPHWYSTMFPVYWFAGCAMSIMALLILLPMGMQAAGRIKSAVTVEHYHDLGKLMFAFIFFWGYVAFSQFMLQWYADLPEETIWFKIRMFSPGAGDEWTTSWKLFSFFILAGHFIFPFLALLSRETKRRLPLLALLALWMLFMHFMDFYFIVMPGMDVNASLMGANIATPYQFGIGKILFIDFAAVIGCVGIFIAAAARFGQRVNLIPTKDPGLGESLAFENY
jgi:hypothetical protein